MLLDEDQNQTHRVKSKRLLTSGTTGCCADDRTGLERVNNSLPDVAQLVQDSAGSQPGRRDSSSGRAAALWEDAAGEP